MIGHRGYDGIMIGLPNANYHLEFTEHIEGSPCPAPTKETIQRIAQRLAQMGYPEVEPENLYWAEKGVTIEDPDGWRIVLMNTMGI